MNRQRATSRKPSSGLREEIRRLGTLLDRWTSHQLNGLFDLSLQVGRRRRIRMSIGILALAVAAFCVHVALYIYFWAGAESPFQAPTLPAMALLTSMRIVLIIGIAASLALNIAGNFLADIFEIKDVSVAWKFIGNLASGNAREVLHLSEGKVRKEDQNSPMLFIGGPGRVQVEFDTAALFEKPDGTPHVVGPSPGDSRQTEAQKPATILDGFERLRAPIINLRDQYIGGLSGDPMRVVGRSLDGMPVSVTDVRAVFSVRRETDGDDAAISPHLPYPFRPRDIEDLIYKQAVPVLTHGDHPSGEPADWTGVMTELIRSSLGEFMGHNRLSDYIAGIGAQEVEVSEFREDTILSRSLQVTNEPAAAGAPSGPAMSRFHPRTELSAKFKKYSGEFSMRAQEHGLQLHWIGVGTWKMADESSATVVDEKHLGAWRMNRENVQRSEPQALDRVAEAALVDGKLRAIQETPIHVHQRNQAKYSDKAILIESLLQGFWEQLGEALAIHYKNGTSSSDLDALEQAVARIEELLRIPHMGHVLGGGTMSRIRPREAARGDQDAPPAPSSRSEAAMYQRLLARLDGNYKVAEAMIANEARRHADLSREDLIARIVQRLARHDH
jgi:hypothetical protein